MEDPQAASQMKSEEGDEIYETIEAPKFVDFTAPDHFPDDADRYWFCLRAGCNQKHEEEMDSETIYKNFVLRVMAARSPNVRLRKALNRKAPSTNVKCPLTAPVKTSKSRISRLAVISSFSQKMVDAKLKNKPVPKLSATPKAKEKQSSVKAKALTTPRNKKGRSNPDTFRSVRNPKSTTIAVPKNRVVAKALVFHSPKKAARMKISSGLNIPVKELCAGLKKLEITGGKKPGLGYHKPLRSDASRRPLRAREVKSRVYDSLHFQNCKDQEIKSSRCQKLKIKQRGLQQFQCQLLHGDKNDSSDMEIDEKSRDDGSVEMCSRSGAPRSSEGNGGEECLTIVKPSETVCATNSNKKEATLSSESPLLGENSDQVALDASRGDRSPSLVEEGHRSNEGTDNVEKIKLNSEMEKISVIMESDDKENDSEVMDSDDKENASASDDNRKLNLDDSHYKRKIFGKRETSKNTKKVTRAMDKTMKEKHAAAITGSQMVKYRKPKPTNPRPFRLRTDERGVRKEANLEKKLHLLSPLNEITSGSSQRNYQNTIQRMVGTTFSKTSQREVERKYSTITPQRRIPVASQQEYSRDKTAQKLTDSSRKTKPPLVTKLARPQGVASDRKRFVSLMTPTKLGVLKETSPVILRQKEAAMPSKCNKSSAAKASSSTTSRSSSRGRRPATIPKEPNFHSIHLPKSCTRKLA